MKRISTVLLAASIFALFASIASAQTQTPGVDARQAEQHQRIAQGVKSGELTKGEARNLRAGQRHVRRMKRRAKADGKVTPRERRRLNRAQNHQSRKIYRLKHNPTTR